MVGRLVLAQEIEGSIPSSSTNGALSSLVYSRHFALSNKNDS